MLEVQTVADFHTGVRGGRLVPRNSRGLKLYARNITALSPFPSSSISGRSLKCLRDRITFVKCEFKPIHHMFEVQTVADFHTGVRGGRLMPRNSRASKSMRETSRL
ncbi:hypothetical protein AVEN_176437-1 [Araneus ventricosus]|uniref:Uncharacterized protein n=1 Tax=Araneus ventricosus TaxID=182803 RepID=A0A4Y2S6Q7_ARAVE|nr:hypothetical protein AVEN_176437-1 [Araneus ventricosus]